MRWVLLTLAVTFLFIFTASPVFAAENLNASDFGDPHPEGVSKSYYKPGERLELIYYITPSSDDKKIKLDGRYYYLYSSLESATLKATVFLATGASIQHQFLNGRCQNPADSCEILDGTIKMSFQIGEMGAGGGVDEIVVEVKGTIPHADKRLEEIKAFWVEVSDADENVLPPVKIKILNLDIFTKDLENAKQKYANLTDRADKLEEMGAVTLDAKDYLEKAYKNITLAENLYKEGEYIKSDEKLSFVEKHLNKAEFELERAEAEHVYENARAELDKLATLVVELELTIKEAKDAGLLVSSYEFQLTSIKNKYSILLNKNEKTSDYLDKDKFKDVILRSEGIINESNQLTQQANSLIAELRGKIDELKQTPTPTPTPTSTPTQAFKIPFLEHRDTLILVGAIIAILIGGGGAVAIAISRYRQKKAYDELK
jgi:hypothetical protein